MPTTTFLISEAKLRQFTDINDNVDSELVKNSIRESQDIGLQYIIGTNLYQKLIDLIDAGTIEDAGNEEYKALLDNYIQNYLLYAAYYYALDSIYLRPRNNGLIQPTGGENSDGVDRSLYNMKRQSVENKMKFYSDMLTRYIIEKGTNAFPELGESNELFELQPDYTEKFGSPFVFNKNIRMAEEFEKRGYRVYDTTRKQYPQ